MNPWKTHIKLKQNTKESVDKNWWKFCWVIWFKVKFSCHLQEFYNWHPRKYVSGWIIDPQARKMIILVQTTRTIGVNQDAKQVLQVATTIIIGINYPKFKHLPSWELTCHNVITYPLPFVEENDSPVPCPIWTRSLKIWGKGILNPPFCWRGALKTIGNKIKTHKKNRKHWNHHSHLLLKSDEASKNKKKPEIRSKNQGTNHPLLGSIKGVHHFLKSFQIASVEWLSARPIGRIHVSMAHVEHIGGGLRGSVLDGCGGATIRDELLLMEEIRRTTTWYGKYPMIYRVLYISGGAGFCPSTVWIFGKKKHHGFLLWVKLVLFSWNFFIQPTQILRLPLLGGKLQFARPSSDDWPTRRVSRRWKPPFLCLLARP